MGMMMMILLQKRWLSAHQKSCFLFYSVKLLIKDSCSNMHSFFQRLLCPDVAKDEFLPLRCEQKSCASLPGLEQPHWTVEFEKKKTLIDHTASLGTDSWPQHGRARRVAPAPELPTVATAELVSLSFCPALLPAPLHRCFPKRPS